MLVGLMGYAYKKLEQQPHEPATSMVAGSEVGVSCRIVSESRGVQCEREASMEVQGVCC